MAPYSSAGAKNEIADDGHFLQKKLLPFILQKKLLLFILQNRIFVILPVGLDRLQ